MIAKRACKKVVGLILSAGFGLWCAAASAVDNNTSARELCTYAVGQTAYTATTMSEVSWDSRPRFSDAVAEAKRRGYTLRYCVSQIRSNPPPEGPITPSPQPSQASSPPPQPSQASPGASQSVPVPDPLVVSIQTLLAALGYDPGHPDGYFGPKTAAAISAFQQSTGDRPDGKASESLHASLRAALAERGPDSASKPRQALRPKIKPRGFGTGFFIASDFLITNYHVIEGCTEIRTRKHGAEIGSARVVATSNADDLAALHSDKSNEHHLKLRAGVPVKSAEAVLVFGYPLSGALSSSGNTTLGNVTALTGLRDDSRYIQISASVQPGSSGGPVLDEAGRLIGVIESKLDALKIAKVTGDIPQNVNFAIRSSTLANFLEANGITYDVATLSTTLPNTQLAEQAEAASVQLECWE